MLKVMGSCDSPFPQLWRAALESRQHGAREDLADTCLSLERRGADVRCAVEAVAREQRIVGRRRLL